MALIWQHKTASCDYQVRRAGNSLRLYTQGVFHSQWNSRRPLAGHLWDLLFLPAVLVSESHAIKSALMLGVGGGAVINSLNYFLKPKKIVGVDLDKVHLNIARRFFLEHQDNVRLVQQDARDFTASDKSRYQFIVEDLFCRADVPGDGAVRAVTMDRQWLKALSARLATSGVLAINFESELQLRRALPRAQLKANGFQSLFSLSLPNYENAIAVCLRQPHNARIFQQRLDAFVESRLPRETKSLRYACRRIV